MSWTKTFSENVFARNVDALLAVAAGVVFVVFVLPSDRPLEDATGLLLAAVTLCAGLFFGVAVAARWMQDRLRDDAYAQIIRRVDPDTRRVQLPFRVAQSASIGAVVWCIFLLLTREEFGRTATVLLYSVGVTLISYAIFSSLLALYGLDRHQRRIQSVLAMKDHLEREARERKRKSGNS